MSASLAVIPAHNEAPRIGPVISAARGFLPVIVVDDGSTDETAAAAEASGATVLRQSPNAGKGAALRLGFRWALDHDAVAVVTLDGDGQHDATEIPRFLDAFEAGSPQPGLVIGARRFRSMPLVRRLSNTLGGVLLSLAVGRSIRDNQSGYRLISPAVMREMLDSHESGFAFEVEMIARCIALGLPIAWVPIRTIYAGEPSHIRPRTHFVAFVRATRDARRIVRGGNRGRS